MSEPTVLPSPAEDPSSPWDRRDLWVCLGIVALAFLLHWPLMRAPVGYMDEGLLMLYPRLMSQGWVVHRDFQTCYGPGFFWFMRAWFAVFGDGIPGTRVFAIALRAFAAILSYALVRDRSRAAGVGLALACLIFVTLMPPRAPTWFSAATLLLAWLFLLTRRAPSAPASALAGLCAAAAVSIRLDTVALAIVVASPWVAVILGKRRFIWYAAALAIGLAPFLAHVALVGPAAIYQNMYLDPLRTTEGRRLPVPAGGGDDLRRFYVLLSAVAVALSAGVAGLVVRGRRGVAAQLVAVLVLALVPYVLQRADRNHFAIVFAIMVPMCGAAVVWLGPRLRPAHRAVAVLAPALALFGMYGDYFHWWAGSYPAMVFGGPLSERVQHDGYTMRVPVGQARAYVALFRAVDAVPGAKTLYVAPANLRCTPYNDVQVYYVFPRLRPAGYYFEMNPCCTNRPDSRLPDDIAAADVLVLGTAWDHWSEPNASTRPGSTRPEEVVARDFDLANDLGLFKVYVNRRLKLSAPRAPTGSTGSARSTATTGPG